MGNSASMGFITPTSRKLSRGRQKEDTVKLEDFLTQCEEDLWRVKAKQRLFVKRVHLARSIHYADLAAQESDSFYPNRGEMLNPAFIGDQGSWMTECNTVNWDSLQLSKRIALVVMFEGLTAASLSDATATWEIFCRRSVLRQLSLLAYNWRLEPMNRSERPRWTSVWNGFHFLWAGNKTENVSLRWVLLSQSVKTQYIAVKW